MIALTAAWIVTLRGGSWCFADRGSSAAFCIETALLSRHRDLSLRLLRRAS